MSLKNSTLICTLIISLLWLNSEITAQRKRSTRQGKRVEKSSKTETRVRKSSPAPAPSKSIRGTPASSHRQGRKRIETKPRRQQTEIKVERRKDVEADNDLRKRKYNLNRPKRTTPHYQPKHQNKRGKPKQHKMDNNFYDNNLAERVYVEEHYEELYPICGVAFHEIGNIYPAFPLRFVDANFNYLFTKRYKFIKCGTTIDNSRPIGGYIEKDIYEIYISVKPKRFNYWDMFGVLIQFSDGGEQIIFFNEDEGLLEDGYIYNFSKQIELKKNGHMKLTLGYYDSFDNVFYPAISYGKRTEIWVYVNRGFPYANYD